MFVQLLDLWWIACKILLHISAIEMRLEEISHVTDSHIKPQTPVCLFMLNEEPPRCCD
jgi:hypothetical protein